MTRLLISLFILVGLTNCANEAVPCTDCSPEPRTTTSDDFDLKKVEIVDKLLTVEVSYGGGCKEHEFTVDWPEAITLIYPPDFAVVLNHNANDDTCEAYLTETVQFDFDESGLGLSDDAISKMRITVINGSNPDQKLSNK